jgi:acetyl esterase/lipase
MRTPVVSGTVLLLLASLAGAQTYTFVPNLVYGTYMGSGGQTHDLLLDLYLPTSGGTPRPLIIWVHGGGWQGGSRFPAPSHATDLCAFGYAVASIDYRLSGTAIWPAQIQDCRGAIRFLRANAATWALDPERFGVWGSSAGGHLVAFLATSGGVPTATIGSVTVDLEGSVGGNLGESSRVQAVCNWFGPTDFLAMRDFPTFDHESAASPESQLLGAPIQTIPDRVATVNPITFLSPDDPPLLMLHGTIDATVPFNQSELLHAAASREAGIPSTLFPVQGNGHGGPGFTSPAALALIHGYFDALLLNPPATRVTAAASDPSASEAGDPGAIDVARTGDLSAPLVVRLAFGGSAARGADYVAPDLFAVIPAGAASVTVPIVPLQDALVEGSETAAVTLCPDPAYRIAPAFQTAVVAIADDDLAGGLSSVTVAAIDGAASENAPNPAGFQVARTAPLAAPLVVHYRLGGRAQNGIDYQALTGSVSIAPGVATANVVVVPINDLVIEPSETVILTLEASASYALGAATTASAYVADNDAVAFRPTVSVLVTDLDASEPGTNGGAFTITRTLGTAIPLAVNLAISGTATPGADYAALPSSITIPAGSDRLIVPVAVLDDPALEGRESVVVSITPSPTYQLASAPSRALTILDDDPPAPPPQLALAVTPLPIGSLASVSIANAPAGQPFGVVVSPGPGFLDVPGFGHALLDLSSYVIVGAGVSSASGAGTISGLVPSTPSSIGAEVWIQAYAIAAGGASGMLSPAAARILIQR